MGDLGEEIETTDIPEPDWTEPERNPDTVPAPEREPERAPEREPEKQPA